MIGITKESNATGWQNLLSYALCSYEIRHNLPKPCMLAGTDSELSLFTSKSRFVFFEPKTPGSVFSGSTNVTDGMNKTDF